MATLAQRRLRQGQAAEQKKAKRMEDMLTGASRRAIKNAVLSAELEAERGPMKRGQERARKK